LWSCQGGLGEAGIVASESFRLAVSFSFDPIRCRTRGQNGFVSGSFLAENHPSSAFFQHLSLVFCPFLQNEPNSIFSLISSFQNTSAFFKWVRLVKMPLFWKVPCQPTFLRRLSEISNLRSAIPLASVRRPSSVKQLSPLYTPRPAASSKKYRFSITEISGFVGLGAESDETPLSYAASLSPTKVSSRSAALVATALCRRALPPPSHRAKSGSGRRSRIVAGFGAGDPSVSH